MKWKYLRRVGNRSNNLKTKNIRNVMYMALIFTILGNTHFTLKFPRASTRVCDLQILQNPTFTIKFRDYRIFKVQIYWVHHQLKNKS